MLLERFCLCFCGVVCNVQRLTDKQRHPQRAEYQGPPDAELKHGIFGRHLLYKMSHCPNRK